MTIEIIFTIVFGKCDELIFQHRTKDEKQLNAECDWISLWNVINCFDVLVSPLLAPTTNNNACSSARYHEILDSWKIFDIVLPLNGWNDANDIQFTIIFFDVLQNLHRYVLATWMEATSKRDYVYTFISTNWTNETEILTIRRSERGKMHQLCTRKICTDLFSMEINSSNRMGLWNSSNIFSRLIVNL